jgi:hypothetical protein
MIETTYVRLEKAAEMLGTDRDTLVLAAMEERIKIYGFIGEALGAIQYQRDETSFHKVFFEVDYVERFFTFVPIAPSMIIRLITDGSCQAVTLSDEKDGYYLGVPDGLEDYSSYLIRREFIFMLKADVEKILSEGKTPDAESVAKQIPVQKSIMKSAITKRTDSLHVIIAALAKQANIKLDDRDAASRIEGCVSRLGASISNGTTASVISEVLECIPDSVERRTRPK